MQPMQPLLKHTRIGVAILIGSLGLTSAVVAPAQAAKKTVKAAKPKALKDIVDTAAAAGSFKTLAAALTAADLVSTLKGAGPFTVFAPTDAAFAKIPKADLDALLADKKKLVQVLTYHVVAGAVPASTVLTLDGKSAKTVNGAEVKIGVSGGKVTLNGNVNVTAVDVKASNGIIHVIDSVLLPPAAAAAAPAAPAAAPAAPTAPAAAPAAPGAVPGGNTIIDVATKAGSFKTLVAAVDAAGLTATLKSAGPFTVFAPTDDAFNVLPNDTIASLLKPENKKALTDILTFHVSAGLYPASKVLSSHDLPTVNGKRSLITVRGGRAFINGAEIKVTDIAASNGIIHVIDTVMIP